MKALIDGILERLFTSLIANIKGMTRLLNGIDIVKLFNVTLVLFLFGIDRMKPSLLPLTPFRNVPKAVIVQQDKNVGLSARLNFSNVRGSVHVTTLTFHIVRRVNFLRSAFAFTFRS